MMFDLVLVGGGLANGLIAYRLQAARPDLRFVVLEQDNALGGNHTWSFHASDVSAVQRAWLAPLVAHSWPYHTIRFPHRRRRLAGAYHSIEAAGFHARIAATLGDRLRLGVRVEQVAPTQVTLADGTVLEARAVIDARGPQAVPGLALGYQKFLGQVVTLGTDHGLAAPILMDATVAQDHDGYRFVYTLPLGPRTALIEDTYYSNGTDLDRPGLRAKIAAYAAAQGWPVEAVLREEQGVLPIVLAGTPDAFWESGAAPVPRAGLRAGLFHPTTGFSLPEAVRLADWIARQERLTSAQLYTAIRARARRLWQRGGFYRLLNRMLFLAAVPAQRYLVMEHFYRLPEAVIERFYAGETTLLDRARILSGRPPVAVRRALGAVLTRMPRPVPARARGQTTGERR